MNILKKNVFRRKKFKLSSLLNIRLVVLSLCVLLPALKVQAQEKQISYPVAIPIERTAATSVSSTAAASALKAPTPIIRSVDEAATPPVRAKAPVKKSTSAPPTAKSAKPPAVKKATTKSTSATAKKKSPATQNAKKPTAKSTPKKSTQNSKATLAKTPAPKKLSGTKPVVSATKVPAQVKNTSERLAPEPSSNKVANTPGHLAVPIIAGAALASAAVSAEEEQELARSLVDEGEYPAELDVPETPMPKAATPAVVAAVPASLAVKTALPMSNQREAFVSEFKQYVETKIVPKTPGLALAIIADGKVKVLETYGVKKAGSNGLINADTAFRLASVSKSFAATAAAMMVNDGLLRWDTKVTDVLPNVEFSNPRYGDQMTVQHILSQATGLPTQANSNFIEEGLSFDEVVRRLRYVNFVCPPGKCYNYQNVTYSLISNIVLKKTGVTYEHYLENKVLRPLGMRTATVGYADYTANNNYAVPHIPTRKGWAPTTVTEHYYRVNPAAGVNASITDMSRWLLAHMGQNPAVLSPSILNAVHAKITRNTPAQNHYGSREGVTNSHYGLGWRVFDYRGDKNFVHHGGGVKGFRSEMVFNPELKIGMVILTNGPRLAGSVIFDFLDAYEDEKRGERKREVTVPVKKKKQ